MARFYRAHGFAVLESAYVTTHSIKAHLGSRATYAYTFVGHGGGTGTVTVTDGAFNPKRHSKHGIAFAEIYACGSADRYFDPRAPWKYNEWELNVATRGYFMGFQGLCSVGACPTPVYTPGVNSFYNRWN